MGSCWNCSGQMASCHMWQVLAGSYLFEILPIKFVSSKMCLCMNMALYLMDHHWLAKDLSSSLLILHCHCFKAHSGLLKLLFCLNILLMLKEGELLLNLWAMRCSHLALDMSKVDHIAVNRPVGCIHLALDVSKVDTFMAGPSISFACAIYNTFDCLTTEMDF